MKKVLSVFLAMVLMLSFTACSMASAPEITSEEALNIALEEAGVSRDAIDNVRTHLDMDDGVLIYEVDFDDGDEEYSYDVDATTGDVVETDRERVD